MRPTLNCNLRSWEDSDLPRQPTPSFSSTSPNSTISRSGEVEFQNFAQTMSGLSASTTESARSRGPYPSALGVPISKGMARALSVCPAPEDQLSGETPQSSRKPDGQGIGAF